jgi:acyl-CoA thioesterase-1
MTSPTTREAALLTLYTFGDSVLDCGWYNPLGVNPGQLLVHNRDDLFPEFAGHDLASRGPARLDHRARDGATVDDLRAQARQLKVAEPCVALVTVGGNDLLAGLVMDSGPGLEAFGKKLEDFLKHLPIKRVLVGNVYDPTFGDDAHELASFLPVRPPVARASHQRLNAVIADVARRYGQLVDLHAHFLTGEPSWYTNLIEPSLVGASEIRRCFLPHLMK